MAGLIVTPPMTTDTPQSSIHSWSIERNAIDNLTYSEIAGAQPDSLFIDANMFQAVTPDDDLPLEEHDHYANKVHGFIAWDLTWPGKVPAGFNVASVPDMLRLYIRFAAWGDHTGFPLPPIPRLNFRWMNAAELDPMFPPAEDQQIIFYPPITSPFGYVASSLIQPHFSVGFDQLVAAEGGTLEIPLSGAGFPGGTFFGLRIWITNLDPFVETTQWGFSFMELAMSDRPDDGWHGPQLVYPDLARPIEASGVMTLTGAAEIAPQPLDPLFHRLRQRRGY